MLIVMVMVVVMTAVVVAVVIVVVVVVVVLVFICSSLMRKGPYISTSLLYFHTVIFPSHNITKWVLAPNVNY